MQGQEGQFELGQNKPSFDGLSFVTMAAHEMKSPLALIRQLSLMLESGNIDIKEQDRMLRQITLTSERALRLTTNLSKSARLEDSLFELEPLNPQQICEEAAHELHPLFKAKGREIRVASRHRSMLVVANRDLLRRIVLNFGDNALHYADSDLPVELRTGSWASGSKVRIGVRDYGPALKPDVWHRLRTGLGSGVQSLHARPQSSGLGLYVAGQFADAMQGQVGATRHKDGATFYVDLMASTQLKLL